jgi:hypothetical protein
MRAVFGVALVAVGIAFLATAATGRRARLVLLGLAALGGAYAVSLAALPGPRAAVSAPLGGALLLVIGECSFLAADRDSVTRSQLLRDLAWVARVGLGAAVVSSLMLLAWTVSLSRSLGVWIAGTICAVAVVALLGVPARAPRADGDSEPNNDPTQDDEYAKDARYRLTLSYFPRNNS